MLKEEREAIPLFCFRESKHVLQRFIILKYKQSTGEFILIFPVPFDDFRNVSDTRVPYMNINTSDLFVRKNRVLC